MGSWVGSRLAVLAVVISAATGCGLIVGIEDYKLTEPPLSALEPSVGTLRPSFDPDILGYALDLPLGALAVMIKPTPGTDGATITVNDEDSASGAFSSPITLALGPTPINVAVTANGVTRTYRIDVSRGAGLSQSVFGKASNSGATDRLGLAVALDGDVMVVGALGEDSSAVVINGDEADDAAADSGAVYVYRRTGTIWEKEAYLKAPNTDAGDGFGQALALDGDVLVVGAPGEDSIATGVGGNPADNTSAGAGAAYVYRRTGTTWAFEAYLKASNTDAGDGFGNAVAIAGNTIAVGAPSEDSSAAGINGNQTDNTAGSAGAVYVFTRVGSAWGQQAYVKASNAGGGDKFGTSVALNSNTLAVGAPDEDSSNRDNESDNATSEAGAVYVMTRNGVTWSQASYVKAPILDASDRFGASVAVRGDDLAVGVPGDDSSARGVGGNDSDDSTSDAGAVRVFTRNGGNWTEQAYLKATGVSAGDEFGARVALDARLGEAVLVVGSPFEDGSVAVVNGTVDDSRADSGAAYVFVRAASSWFAVAYLKVANPGSGDGAAFIAVSGARVVVGAPGEDSGATNLAPPLPSTPDEAKPDSGAFYTFE